MKDKRRKLNLGQLMKGTF